MSVENEAMLEVLEVERKWNTDEPQTDSNEIENASEEDELEEAELEVDAILFARMPL